MAECSSVSTAEASSTIEQPSTDTPANGGGQKERAKVIKQHKLSARLAILSKGGQKNNVFRATVRGGTQKDSLHGGMVDGKRVEVQEIVTSDYDSCFETDVDAEGGEGGRRVDLVDYDDADSGVIENATGHTAMVLDLGVSVTVVCCSITVVCHSITVVSYSIWKVTS